MGAETGQLHAGEAERLIGSLRAWGVERVGSCEWTQQQEALQRLNAQAHLNAQTHSDEFVVEALVSLDRLTTLVECLLEFEVWQEAVCPLLQAQLLAEPQGLSLYLTLFYGAATANFLEVVLFHEHACEALSDDAVLELCDWCCRKALALQRAAPPPASAAGADVAQQEAEEAQGRAAELDFSAGITSLTILRYLTQHLAKLPLGLAPRLVVTNDALMVLVPLLLRPPWVRRQGKGLQRWADGQWQALQGRDKGVLGSTEAQVWLSVYNLLSESSCRSRYQMTEHRMEQLRKLRPLMTDILLDQLPILQHLQVVLDKLVFGSNNTAGQPASLMVIEQVPQMRARLVQDRHWAAIARQQAATIFSQDSMARIAAFADSVDQLDALAGSRQRQGAAEGDMRVRVHLWHTAADGAVLPWADHELVPDASAPPVRVKLADPETQASLSGWRHRLQVVGDAEARPVPGKGRVSAVFQDRAVEAWLELPCAETRGHIQELPLIAWVTIGLLARDTFALQLKLRREASAAVRSAATGQWHPYVLVGGALTQADANPSSEALLA